MNVENLLPDDFKESLTLVPKNRPVSLLTRHSIREQAENYNASYSLPLTDEGIVLATHWGTEQCFTSFQLFSSPVGRCIETAKHMWSGKFVEDPKVQVASCLAEPGCFIDDVDIMRQLGKVFVGEGPVSYLNKMISGGFDEHLSVDAGMSKLMNHLRDEQEQSSDSQLNIHVTHDTVLGTFIYRLLSYTQLDEDHWPRMMEGVYVWFEGENLHGVWRKEVFTVKISDFLKSQ